MTSCPTRGKLQRTRNVQHINFSKMHETSTSLGVMVILDTT